MNVPAVSIILPAFNCEKFIDKAINSVLKQTFTGFEFIIINDGSTDKTEMIVLNYADPRIVYLKNPENKGLIYTLNRALALAHGKYIARMDADDICLPERIAKQKEFLDQNTNIAVLATTIDFINDTGEKTGVWKLDRQTTTPEQIKRKIIFENCIAHPTVMMRAELVKELKYSKNQKNIEDYDLWLRVLNRGYKIAKLEEPLLLYRRHDESVTSKHLKKTNPFFKHLVMKTRFLRNIFWERQYNWFTFKISLSRFIDLFKGLAKVLKNISR
jgi:glycosyltransferase involved in cell wall biosynthesis